MSIRFSFFQDPAEPKSSVKSNKKLKKTLKPDKSKKQKQQQEHQPLLDEKDLFVEPAQEPLSKEKLKYLRYFRLVTHRKKNGTEL